MPSLLLPPRDLQRYLQPLGRFLLLVSVVLAGSSIWHMTSSTPETAAESFVSGFGASLLMGSLLCTAYSPQGAQVYSPQRKNLLRATFFLVLASTLLASIFNLLAHRQKQAQETTRLDLTSKVAALEGKVKQFKFKKPTRQELKQLDAELERLKQLD